MQVDVLVLVLAYLCQSSDAPHSQCGKQVPGATSEEETVCSLCTGWLVWDNTWTKPFQSKFNLVQDRCQILLSTEFHRNEPTNIDWIPWRVIVFCRSRRRTVLIRSTGVPVVLKRQYQVLSGGVHTK